MRTYTYIEPTDPENNNWEPVKRTVTEGEILATYFEHWKKLMTERGKAHLISARACIEDWVVVNWAVEGGLE
jgi:hypothetical protein